MVIFIMLSFSLQVSLELLCDSRSARPGLWSFHLVSFSFQVSPRRCRKGAELISQYQRLSAPATYRSMVILYSFYDSLFSVSVVGVAVCLEISSGSWVISSLSHS